MEASYIKKSTLIRDFRMQVSGKSKTIIQTLDSAFFNTINRIFRKTPHDVKLHITPDNTLTFNMNFKNNVNVYLEYYPKCEPQSNTLLTISRNEDTEDSESMDSNELSVCLDIIDDTLAAQSA